MAAAILSSTLTREGVAPLRDIATKLHNLATTCLMLLRIEVRAQCLYYLVPTLRLVSYYCDAESVEADSRVIALNKVLTSFDEVLSTCLSKVRRIIEEELRCLSLKRRTDGGVHCHGIIDP